MAANTTIDDTENISETNDKNENNLCTKDDSNIINENSSLHLLEGHWTFWYTHRPTTLRNSSVNYDSCLKNLGAFIIKRRFVHIYFCFYPKGTFGSIEEFWCYYDHMKFPSDLPLYRLMFTFLLLLEN